MVSNLVILSLFLAMVGPTVVSAWIMSRKAEIGLGWIRCLGLLLLPDYLGPFDLSKEKLKMLQTFRARTQVCSLYLFFALIFTYSIIFVKK